MTVSRPALGFNGAFLLLMWTNHCSQQGARVCNHIDVSRYQTLHHWPSRGGVHFNNGTTHFFECTADWQQPYMKLLWQLFIVSLSQHYTVQMILHISWVLHPIPHQQVAFTKGTSTIEHATTRISVFLSYLTEVVRLRIVLNPCLNCSLFFSVRRFCISSSIGTPSVASRSHVEMPIIERFSPTFWQRKMALKAHRWEGTLQNLVSHLPNQPITERQWWGETVDRRAPCLLLSKVSLAASRIHKLSAVFGKSREEFSRPVLPNPV